MSDAPKYHQHRHLLSGRRALDKPRLDAIVLTRAGLAAGALAGGLTVALGAAERLTRPTDQHTPRSNP